MTKKYALYDYDSETMLTGPVYDTAREAADDIDSRLTNVTVVAVDVEELDAET